MIKNGKTQIRRREVGKFLVIDPEICHGQMTFKGTRVPVATILALMGKGYSMEQMLSSYPQVSRVAIQEAIQLAIVALKQRYDRKLPTRQKLAA